MCAKLVPNLPLPDINPAPSLPVWTTWSLGPLEISNICSAFIFLDLRPGCFSVSLPEAVLGLPEPFHNKIAPLFDYCVPGT